MAPTISMSGLLAAMLSRSGWVQLITRMRITYI